MIGMGSQLALVNQTFLGRVHELDRIFNGKNMPLESLVQIINHRGQVVDLPDPVGPVTSFFLLAELLQNWRHFQLLERQDLGRNGAKDRAFAFALQDIDPEARHRAHLEREIAFVALFECLALGVVHDVVNEMHLLLCQSGPAFLDHPEHEAWGVRPRSNDNRRRLVRHQKPKVG